MTAAARLQCQEPASGLRAGQRRERHHRMLDAAQDLFNERGYDATPVEEIAARAAVSAATVYNYFETKQNIIMALAERHLATCLPERQAFVRNPPHDPCYAVRMFTALLIDQSLRVLNRNGWRVIFRAFYTEPGGGTHAKAEQLNGSIFEHYRELLGRFLARGLLRHDVDLDALCQVLFAINAYNWRRYMSDEQVTLDDVKHAVDQQIVVVFRGLVPSRPTVPRTHP